MNDKEAMKLALEALKDNQHLVADNERHAYVMEYNAIIEKLEEALSKQEQDEPIQVTIKDFVKAVEGKEDLVGLPIYWAQWPNGNTPPQQRTWVGLTDEEMQAVVDAQPLVSNINVYFKSIEAKLKEKNNE